MTESYQQWSDALLELQAIVSPAQLQGMLCGRLSGGQRLEQTAWLEAAIEFMDLIDASLLGEQSRNRLVAFYETNLSNLQDLDCPLELLLPPDAVSLQQRLDALAEWCEGFLHGLGVSGLSGDSELPPEVAEALRDLAQISQAQIEEDGTEENEQDYAELVEYVRVAVLTLFVELNAHAPAASKRIH